MEVYVQLKTDPKWATVAREKRLSTAESDLEIVQSRIDEFMGNFVRNLMHRGKKILSNKDWFWKKVFGAGEISNDV